MTIQAVLLDFDGVLRHWPPAVMAAIEAAAGLPPGVIAAVAFAPACVAPALRGEIADAAWREAVAAGLRAAHPAQAVAIPAAVAAWTAGGEIDPAALALVRAVRRRVPVILVSNATTRLPADLTALGLIGELDGVVSSAVVGVTKPHPAIFAAALATAGVPAAAALFVDDDQRNVTAAASLGLRAARATNADQLQQVLSDAGLLPAFEG